MTAFLICRAKEIALRFFKRKTLLHVEKVFIGSNKIFFTGKTFLLIKNGFASQLTYKKTD